MKLQLELGTSLSGDLCARLSSVTELLYVLGGGISLSESHFPHLSNGDDNCCSSNVLLIGIFRGLGKNSSTSCCLSLGRLGG